MQLMSLKILGILILACVLSLISISPTSAATFTVNNWGDVNDSLPGDGICATHDLTICTLRAAIKESNFLPGPDEIIISNLPYSIELGQRLEITDDLTISAEGPNKPGLTATNGLLWSTAKNLTISNINFRGFQIMIRYGGGPTNVTLSGVVVRDCSQCSYENEAGGITAKGSGTPDTVMNVNIIGCTISGNNGYMGGGLLVRDRANVTVRDTTISGNTALNDGGGIHVFNGELTLINSTVYDNNYSTGPSDGAIYVGTGGTAKVINSTINNNHFYYGGGIYIGNL